MPIENKWIARRIRAARESCGFTQQELADKIGIKSGQTISAIEKAEREVKALELYSVAKALYRDVSYFLKEDDKEKTYRVIWRGDAEDKVKEKEAYFVNKCKQYYHVEQLNDETHEFGLPQFEFEFGDKDEGYEKAEFIANEVYNVLNLGPRPAVVLESILEERYRVKIWYANLKDAGSAASLIGDFGPAIFVNRNEAPWRMNFSLAHELFHLVTWSAYLKTECTELTEKFANKFASILLLPCDEVRKTVGPKIKAGRIAYIDLVNSANEFGVSTAAFLWRLCWLGYLTSDSVKDLLEDGFFKNLDKEARAGEKREVREFAERFVKLGVTSYIKGRLSKGQLANYLETNIADINDVLMEYDIDIGGLSGGDNELSIGR